MSWHKTAQSADTQGCYLKFEISAYKIRGKIYKALKRYHSVLHSRMEIKMLIEPSQQISIFSPFLENSPPVDPRVPFRYIDKQEKHTCSHAEEKSGSEQSAQGVI